MRVRCEGGVQRQVGLAGRRRLDGAWTERQGRERLPPQPPSVIRRSTPPPRTPPSPPLQPPSRAPPPPSMTPSHPHREESPRVLPDEAVSFLAPRLALRLLGGRLEPVDRALQGEQKLQGGERGGEGAWWNWVTRRELSPLKPQGREEGQQSQRSQVCVPVPRVGLGVVVEWCSAPLPARRRFLRR